MRFVWPILLLAGGMAVLCLASLAPATAGRELFILALFGAYNGLIVYFFELKRESWSLKRLWHFLPAFFLGAIPILSAYSSLGFPAYRGITPAAIALTLATVAWEELWFRGAPLELASRSYGRLGSAILFGALFALMHLLNPKIDLFADGIQLFLAGYTLSLCYFAFGSIWAPIGMHFANNSIQAAFGQSVEPRSWMYTGPLLAISILLTAFCTATRGAAVSR